MDDINTNPKIEEADLVTSSDIITEMVTGIPDPFKKNALKAFGQLCTAAVDIPIAYLEGKASEIRAGTDARVSLINSGSEQIAQQMNIPTNYVDAATNKFAQKIIQERINVDTISLNAKQELEQESFADSVTSPEEISSDWLNSFEKEATTKSSEEMQLLFGKILAGELKKPSTYSIRTVKILAQLNEEVAELFQRFCSMCSTLYVGDEVYNSSLFSLGKNASQSNALTEFGMQPKKLNLLIEYGLLDPSFTLGLPTRDYIKGPKTNKPIPFKYNKDFFILQLDEEEKLPERHRLYGPSLTKSGEELLGIVDIIPNDSYTKALKDYLSESGVKMHKIESM